MKNIILIAPPAAGKGTVSNLLKEKYNYTHLSAGDVLREEIKSGSALGNSIKEIVRTGGLVDDDMLKELMYNKFKNLPKDKPIVIDGYPRKINQAEDYKDIVEKLGLDQGIAIFLNIDEETALKRTLGRLNCQNCEISYNINSESHKPKVDGICDKCGQKLESREDDNPTTFKNRFHNYLTQTEQLINYYKQRNNIIELDATKNTIDIVEEIVNSLGGIND